MPAATNLALLKEIRFQGKKIPQTIASRSLDLFLGDNLRSGGHLFRLMFRPCRRDDNLIQGKRHQRLRPYFCRMAPLT